MMLLVGLGNPGVQYAENRHNIGFMAIDHIHRRHGFPSWRSRFQADSANGMIGTRTCLLLKPMTFMNESGRAVGAAMRFYKLTPQQLVILHDDLDLKPGKIRLKQGGGHAGHNGLRSISAHIGDQYRRLRIGIGHPGNKQLVQHHVLSNFDKIESCWLKPLLDHIADSMSELVNGHDAAFMNRLHLAMTSDPRQEQTSSTRTGRDTTDGEI